MRRGSPAEEHGGKKMGPSWIEGEIHADERGEIVSVNGFSLEDVRRFYVISNESPETIRAWQGHKKETKYFFALEGSF
jgi:dTDP-4-dehydrorhamnose 3,5-epimerase